MKPSKQVRKNPTTEPLPVQVPIPMAPIDRLGRAVETACALLSMLHGNLENAYRYRIENESPDSGDGETMAGIESLVRACIPELAASACAASSQLARLSDELASLKSAAQHGKGAQ